MNPTIPERRRQACIAFSDNEIISIFGRDEAHDALVKTGRMAKWGATIAAGWLFLSHDSKQTAISNIRQMVISCYAEMAMFRSRVMRAGPPALSSPVMGIIPKLWLESDLIPPGFIAEWSYAENAEFAKRFDLLVAELEILREAHDPTQQIDFREGTFEYRHAVLDAVTSVYPDHNIRYALRHGVPFVLWDKIDFLRSSAFLRTIEAAPLDDPKWKADRARDRHEITVKTYQVYEEAIRSRLHSPPKPPQDDLPSIRTIYLYLCELLEWCGAGSVAAEPSLDNEWIGISEGRITEAVQKKPDGVKPADTGRPYTIRELCSIYSIKLGSLRRWCKDHPEWCNKTARSVWQISRHAEFTWTKRAPAAQALSVTDSAKLTGFSKGQISKLANKGKVKCWGAGQDRRIDLDSLTEYILEHRSPERPESAAAIQSKLNAAEKWPPNRP